jgi:hypothetical protein
MPWAMASWNRNVILPARPWVYIDYASPGMVKRFYRVVGTGTTPETNAPIGMVLIPAEDQNGNYFLVR